MIMLDKMIHQVMAKVPPAMHLAMSIRIRSEAGEPQVKAGYYFGKSDYSYDLEKIRGPANKYVTPEGVSCTLAECAAHLGLSETRTSVLFTENKNDYEKIFSTFGDAKNNMHFKTDQGEKTSAPKIAAYYKITPSSVSRAYKKFDNDYLKANAYLFNKFKDNVLGT